MKGYNFKIIEMPKTKLQLKKSLYSNHIKSRRDLKALNRIGLYSSLYRNHFLSFEESVRLNILNRDNIFYR